MLLQPYLSNCFYQVCQGDTHESISDQFHVTAASLKKNYPALYVGQFLAFSPPAKLTHRVRPFETLQSIAANYQTTVQHLQSENNLTEIFTGLELTVFR